MASVVDKKDKRGFHKRVNTLECVLYALVGEVTTIELHNDAYVVGKISQVSGGMNVELKEVKYVCGNDKEFILPDMFVHGRKIRYVHIPDHLDAMELVKMEIERATKKPDNPVGRGSNRRQGHKSKSTKGDAGKHHNTRGMGPPALQNLSHSQPSLMGPPPLGFMVPAPYGSMGPPPSGLGAPHPSGSMAPTPPRLMGPPSTRMMWPPQPE